MKRSAEFDPARLDVDTFVDQGGALRGERALTNLGRLASLVLAEPEPGAGLASWSAAGERRLGADRQPQRWIHLSARCTVRMTCQRCLEPVVLDLAVDRSMRFVPTEAEAERLDLESDEDVLATSRRLDLLELVEDELILALPAVPKHADCRAPAASADPLPAPAERPNPFSVLRRGRPPG